MRPEKKAIIEEVQGEVDASSYVVLVDCLGLNVEKTADLRGRLRETDSRLTTVKNSFLKVAVQNLGLGAGLELEGPTSMVTGAGDVTQVAKVLRTFRKENERPAVKGGLLGGKVLSADDVVAMADIPSREIMLGILVGTIAAPMTQLVGVMQQKVLSLLYVLKAVEEKKKGGDS
jgi:large subunit ribosomal protein L10